MKGIRSGLYTILGIKKQIQENVESKGIEVSNDVPFEQYPEKIISITLGKRLHYRENVTVSKE